jgi:hypothetical protein
MGVIDEPAVTVWAVVVAALARVIVGMPFTVTVAAFSRLAVQPSELIAYKV